MSKENVPEADGLAPIGSLSSSFKWKFYEGSPPALLLNLIWNGSLRRHMLPVSICYYMAGCFLRCSVVCSTSAKQLKGKDGTRLLKKQKLVPVKLSKLLLFHIEKADTERFVQRWFSKQKRKTLWEALDFSTLTEDMESGEGRI